ncbi:ABC transporter ATP-binding protein [Lautropia dentalis]|uniref:ABC transporter ATP-binding protein n=1 Tax=Lautropia dentalis TaxID=2490857 RepID=A0A426FP27_9BURK|nr:ABC transporter ATP-binding protein [Lautropia dentalis]RRN44437.1 ABC transporter ATP-binding protein [Lautropia dentalis]
MNHRTATHQASQPDVQHTHITPWRETLRQLLRSAQPHSRAFARSLWMILTAAILHGLALACIIPLFQALLDGHTPNWHTALLWLVLILLLTLTVQTLRWQAQDFDYDGMQADAIHNLRTRLGEQLRRMPLLKLQSRRTGELSAVLLGNVDENLNYTLTICGGLINGVVTPLVSALATLLWDWKLGLAMLLVFPAIIPLHRWRRPQQQKVVRELNDAHTRCHGDIIEYTQGLAVLRASRATGSHAGQLQDTVEWLERLQVDSQRQGIKANVVISSVTEAGMLLIMAAGVTWVTQGQLDLTTLAAVTIMLVRFAEPLALVFIMTGIIEHIETALIQIDELLAIEPLPQQTPAQVPQQFDIRFDDVTFAYEARPVLSGFSATLPARSMTALVGPSGGGKTTVTRLLMRHADPQHGTVTIGGVDVRAIEPERLNRLVSVVFQDVYLFDDTVLANIRMARPEATDAEVHAAARAAHCLEFIERLPQGWNTRIGETGGRLSGGERQRLSIARALLKDAPIVVLDEPTATLDTESERAVQRAIETLVKNRTVIVIAHRLSTIAGAGQIIVVDQGKALETGTHEALLAGNGRYAALWAAQQRAKQWRAGSA